MAFVSQCVNCNTLTMMTRCPKCGGSTTVYQGTGGVHSRVAARTASVASSASSAPSRAPPTATVAQEGSLGVSTAGRGRTFTATPHQTPSVRRGPPEEDDGLPSVVAPSPSSPIPATVASEVARLREALKQKEEEVSRMAAAVGSSSFANSEALQANRGSGAPAVSTQGELSALWASRVNEQQLQIELAALRDKYNTLLADKDRWMLDTLKLQEAHQQSLQTLDDQCSAARRDAQAWQVKAVGADARVTELERKLFDAEEAVHLYVQRMQQATDEVRELQRAVASSKEADRQELERAKQDLALNAKRIAEQEEDLRAARLRIADLKDDVETGTALRQSIQQKLQALTLEREELLEAKRSVERQLSLSVVEQRALADENDSLRNRLHDAAVHHYEEGSQRRRSSPARHQSPSGRSSPLYSSAGAMTSAERAVLLQQLEDAQQALEQAKRERVAALDAAEALRSEVRRLSAANAALDEEVYHSRRSNEVLGQELGGLRGEIREVRASFADEQRRQQEKHAAELAALRSELASKTAEYAKASEVVAKVQRDAEVERLADHKTRAELKESLSALQSQFAEKDVALQRALEELERKREMSPTRIGREKAMLQDRVEDTQSSLENERRAAHEARSQRDALRLEWEEAQRQLVNERMQHATLSACLQAIAREAGNLYSRDELPAAVRRLLQERNEAVEAKEAAEAALRQSNALHHDETSHLRTTLAETASQLQAAENRLRSSDDEYRRVQLDIASKLRDQESQWKLRVQKLESQADVDRERLQSECEQLRQANEGTKRLHSSAEEQLRSHAQERQRLVAELQRVTGERNSLAEAQGHVQEREAAYRTALEELQLQLHASRANEKEVHRQLSAAMRDNEQLRRDTEAAAVLLGKALDEEQALKERESERQRQELESVRAQLNMERNRRAMDAEVVRAAEARCHELESTTDHVKLERDQCQKECATLRKTHAATLEAMQGRIKDLEAESEELRRRAEDVAERLAAREKSLTATEFALDDANREIERLHGQKDAALRRMDTFRTSNPTAAAPAATSSHGPRAPPSLSASSPSSSYSVVGRRVASPPREGDLSGSGQQQHHYPAQSAQSFQQHQQPPPPQRPVPLPHGPRDAAASGHYSMGGGAGSTIPSVRERNDYLLAQFREQRSRDRSPGTSTTSATGGRPASGWSAPTATDHAYLSTRTLDANNALGSFHR